MDVNELKGALKGNIDKLSDEAKDKLKAAQTKAEALGILNSEGVELTHDALDNVSGGESQEDPIIYHPHIKLPEVHPWNK